MNLAKPIAAMVMAGCLTGAAVDPDSISPRDPKGPTCYGSNYEYVMWNSTNPQVVHGLDSCRIAQLIATRAMVSNFSQFVTLLAIKFPQQVWPAQLLIVVFNAQTGVLQQCAAPGKGIEMVTESEGGGLAWCRSQ